MSSEKRWALFGMLIFSLIEIAIIAYLFVNHPVLSPAPLHSSPIAARGPFDLLAQSRDSTRISDLSNLKAAVALYLADVENPKLCEAKTLYTSGAITGVPPPGWKVSDRMGRAVDGTGWLPVNLTAISSGAPLGNLPVDPVNKDGLVYLYTCDPTNQTYEFDAIMESQKYSKGGVSDIVSTDEGNDPEVYETGNSLTIISLSTWNSTSSPTR